MKKKIFLIHKWIGVLSFLVIFNWSLTGFINPIISWIQPVVKNQDIGFSPLKLENFEISPSNAFKKNQIDLFSGLRIVEFDRQNFYQIHPPNITDIPSHPIYINTITGDILPEGDRIYAKYLARHFTNETKANVSYIERITEFNSEYRVGNRFLPVYKVCFESLDGLCVYVDTHSSKIANISNTKKELLQWLFVNFHSFEITGMPDIARRLTISFLMSIVFLTSLSGIIVYVLFWKVFGKNKVETGRSIIRKYHRSIGIIVSIFALAWSGSGMFRNWAKFDFAQFVKIKHTQEFSPEDMKISFRDILADNDKITAISLVQKDQEKYYRIVSSDQKTTYLNTKTGNELINGDLEYAKSLGEEFTNLANPISITPVTNFTDEYPSTYKRLPVVKVQFSENTNQRLYIDTSEGRLAYKIGDDLQQTEITSFRYFHRGRWLDWAGNVPRDIFLMTMALGNSIVSFLGIWLFLGLRMQKNY